MATKRSFEDHGRGFDNHQNLLHRLRLGSVKIMRLPSAVLIIAATIFLLYLIPWHNLPAVPSPANFRSLEEVQQQQYRIRHIFPASHIPIALDVVNVPGLVSYRNIQESNTTFNASGIDVLVILHIQKTGGTSFEKHIVQDLSIEKPCSCWKRKKRCKCPRPGVLIAGSNATVGGSAEGIKSSDSWLFSRFSLGWACGLHADWTELTGCVDNELNRAHGSPTPRRYFYVTMIRDPIHRFLSEYRHVKRGATWKASRHFCNGRMATADELGSCYLESSWRDVTLNKFLSCPHNLAFNRQTRMLADLTLVGCYNKSYMPEDERNRVILASAKRNLETIAFVGLTEFQRISQYVFEETFKVRFRIPFTQNEDTYSKSTLEKVTPDELEQIRKVNALDLDLYSFAEQLLHSRFEELKFKDKDFSDHYYYLGEDKGNRFSWEDLEKEE